jgi:RimJ/RimL family protein N-acetyltransferase
MRLVIGEDAAVAAWVAARIAWMPPQGFGPCAAIGVEAEDGRALGGVVFSNYQPCYRSIDIAGAAETPRWLTRRLIGRILSYPFVQLDCLRVTAVTPKKARNVRQTLEKLGFKREGAARLGFGRHGTAIIYGLIAPDWRRGPFGPDAVSASRAGSGPRPRAPAL